MTGQKLFETALDLCGLRNDDGTLSADVSDLSERALSFINLLIAENASLAARFGRTALTVSSISALTDEIPLPEILCASALPYGMARLILVGEDDETASRFGILYNEIRAEVLRAGRAANTEITEVY